MITTVSIVIIMIKQINTMPTINNGPYFVFRIDTLSTSTEVLVGKAVFDGAGVSSPTIGGGVDMILKNLLL
ncbi:hypothetical protein TVAG_488350 [Trichomonas vaginalis G3]|uniref:Uncharacterized protein n=1 Tax=Trichomonas vaginalis (strain ATCC PRA-98 / G3) TaxID=412133 RepID=A2E6M8_TRIV3|nr:hypothetical protein TVAGG3_0817640 [Trichomonas vaginalis G3]EAY11733.1 hypothetical protein TVAG_488350 [Trichomonas vaginalis G3]KAI5497643.1 hypothetical protein TVAGG3_0817640 [Trichomonas vaginalis G3]|eukprot:XP_001323956.1 hypothetical protein [Trichomonas vaginalis G3]